MDKFKTVGDAVSVPWEASGFPYRSTKRVSVITIYK